MLRERTLDPILISAIRKIVADAAAYPLFHLFALFDGVADPSGLKEWFGVDLCSPSEEDRDLLHDHFFETYWDWVKKRGNSLPP